MIDVPNMTPKDTGSPMLVDVSERGVKAFAGTGFDIDSPHIYPGNDAARYAVMIQQHRDAGDFAAADRARQFAERWYYVMQERDGTLLLPHPRGWTHMTIRQRSRYRPATLRQVIVDGLAFDDVIAAPQAMEDAA